ncbi:hypothetical protein TNCV_4227691 [Trichonephila clavipes]|nr:hypothetical protein TNCV_4227691 [Trichonephila clavipes]
MPCRKSNLGCHTCKAKVLQQVQLRIKLRKNGYRQTRKTVKEWHKHILRAQQSNIKPDLRMHICEHIIRVLQHQKDVNQKQHICVKHDFVMSNHTITVTLHSGTTQWKILGSGSMFSFMYTMMEV